MAGLLIYLFAIVIVFCSLFGCSFEEQHCASDNANDSCLFDSTTLR